MELEPTAVLFHLISISGEKQREKKREGGEGWRGGDGGAAGERMERDFNPAVLQIAILLMEVWRTSCQKTGITRALEILSQPSHWLSARDRPLLKPETVVGLWLATNKFSKVLCHCF